MCFEKINIKLQRENKQIIKYNKYTPIIQPLKKIYLINRFVNILTQKLSKNEPEYFVNVNKKYFNT